MTSITFNVPKNVNINALVQALSLAGIIPDLDDIDDDAVIPHDMAMAMVFPEMTHSELIGAKLKTIREDVNLTQKALAELVDENAANISAMERGKRSISKKMASKLAKALGVPYHTFL